MAERIDPGVSLALRAMSAADIPLGMELKTLAGWNQLAGDWEMFLAAGGEGFVASLKGKDVGTAMTIPYEDRFTWIAMVLVHPTARRMGIGKALLNRCIERCASTSTTARLDATPAGYELYKTLGFSVEYELFRMIRPFGGPAPARRIKQSDLPCQPVSKAALPALKAFDRPVFGADRGFILEALQARNPAYAWMIKEREEIRAYCLGRSGSNFEQMGPLIAEDIHHAKALYGKLIHQAASKDLVMDVPADRKDWIAFLEQEGFRRQRPFIRMYLGELNHPGIIGKHYAIAGPEIG